MNLRLQGEKRPTPPLHPTLLPPLNQPLDNLKHSKSYLFPSEGHELGQGEVYGEEVSHVALVVPVPVGVVVILKIVFVNTLIS